MKKLFIIFYFLPALAFSQNLLGNGGFEQYSSLPDGYCEWDRCTGWSNVNGSLSCGAYGTPDYYSTIGLSPAKLPDIGNNDSINPHSGDAIMGFITMQIPPNLANYREYLMTKMSTPMVSGTTYKVSFYLSNAYHPFYGYGSNNIGIHFSNAVLHQAAYGVINVVPQVEIDTIVFSNDWVYFQFNYTADSAYQYFTIGNFKYDSLSQYKQFYNSSHMAYYFIDDIDVESVSVPPPVAAFQSNKTNLCMNDCINFTDLSINNPTSWKWSFPGASPSSSTDENPYICYTDSGTFDVTLIAYNSGGSDTLTVSNYINVLSSPPTPGIKQNGPILYCNTDSSYISYQWFDSTIIIPGATDTLLIITHGGNYNLQVTNKYGCKVAVGINVVLALPDYTNSNSVSIRPNPVGDQLTIGYRQNVISSVSIYNVLGTLCYKYEIESRTYGTESEIRLNVSGLAAGVYFVKIESDSGTRTAKIIKE